MHRGGSVPLGGSMADAKKSAVVGKLALRCAQGAPNSVARITLPEKRANYLQHASFMISTLPPPPRMPGIAAPRASEPRDTVPLQRAPIVARREEPVRYPSLQALLIAASHCARSKHEAVQPYADRILGLVGFRIGERVFVLDRAALDRALRDPRMSAITRVLAGKDGWIVVGALLAEGWRPPGPSER